MIPRRKTPEKYKGVGVVYAEKNSDLYPLYYVIYNAYPQDGEVLFDIIRKGQTCLVNGLNLIKGVKEDQLFRNMKSYWDWRDSIHGRDEYEAALEKTVKNAFKVIKASAELNARLMTQVNEQLSSAKEKMSGWDWFMIQSTQARQSEPTLHSVGSYMMGISNFWEVRSILEKEVRRAETALRLFDSRRAHSKAAEEKKRARKMRKEASR